MFTIKQAARLTGVREATLRTWERRYEIVAPDRTASGYRLYSDEAIATISTMRRLLDAGWLPAQAAQAIRAGDVEVGGAARPEAIPGRADRADATTYMENFLACSAEMDIAGIEESLDGGFSIGSFEYVVDAWLCPSLVALGEGWARGEIDVAGEHAGSHAVLRRLAGAFEAAGSRSRGATVVVGLPTGSLHELGALAFATAIKRLGCNVVYLGADVPESSWDVAVAAHPARAAVLGVVTAADRASAAGTAERLMTSHPEVMVAAGGASGAHLTRGVHTLPGSIGAAALELDEMLNDKTSDSGPEPQ